MEISYSRCWCRHTLQDKVENEDIHGRIQLQNTYAIYRQSTSQLNLTQQICHNLPQVRACCNAKWLAHCLVNQVGCCASFCTTFVGSQNDMLLPYLFTHGTLSNDDCSDQKQRSTYSWSLIAHFYVFGTMDFSTWLTTISTLV